MKDRLHDMAEDTAIDLFGMMPPLDEKQKLICRHIISRLAQHAASFERQQCAKVALLNTDRYTNLSIADWGMLTAQDILNRKVDIDGSIFVQIRQWDLKTATAEQ